VEHPVAERALVESGKGGVYLNEFADRGARRARGHDRQDEACAAKGKGCVNEVEITIRASVPLIGSKLAQFVARDTEATLAAEYAFIQDYLDHAN
jgi:hypothetical protein